MRRREPRGTHMAWHFEKGEKKCGHSRAINKSRRITTTQSVAAPDRHDSMVQTDSARLAKHTRRQYKQAARRVRLVGGGWESRGVRGDAQVARRPFFKKKKTIRANRAVRYITSAACSPGPRPVAHCERVRTSWRPPPSNLTTMTFH